MFAGFSLSVLAGLGLEELPRLEGAKLKRALLAGLWLSAALTLLWLWAMFKPYLAELTAAEKSFLFGQLPVFAGAVAAASLAVILAGTPASAWVKPLCLAWTALELIYYGAGFNPSLARPLYYPETPAIEFLRADRSAFRLLGLGWALGPDTGLVYGLDDARGQDFATVKRYEELVTGASGEFFFYAGPDRLPPSFAALGVKYVLADNPWKAPADFERVYRGEISVYRSKLFAGRALIPEGRETERPERILKRLRSKGFDPRETLLLEEEPLVPPRNAAKAPFPGRARTRIVSDSPDEVRIEASTPKPAFLLLLDTYFPGWKAEVDGSPAKIYRADYNFRAVALPAGTSEVRFRYEPASFRAGLGLALASLFLLAALLAAAARPL